MILVFVMIWQTWPLPSGITCFATDRGSVPCRSTLTATSIDRAESLLPLNPRVRYLAYPPNRNLRADDFPCLCSDIFIAKSGSLLTL